MSDLERVTVWLTSEAGTSPYGCAPTPVAGQTMIDRYVGARVCTKGELLPCCEATGYACALDAWGFDDAPVIAGYALARSEGRHIDPPHRCPVHGGMTFGGCCHA